MPSCLEFLDGFRLRLIFVDIQKSTLIQIGSPGLQPFSWFILVSCFKQPVGFGPHSSTSDKAAENANAAIQTSISHHELDKLFNHARTVLLEGRGTALIVLKDADI